MCVCVCINACKLPGLIKFLTLQYQRVRATGPDQVLDTWALRNPIASEWLSSLRGSRPDLDAEDTLLSSTRYLRMRASQRSKIPNESLDGLISADLYGREDLQVASVGVHLTLCFC